MECLNLNKLLKQATMPKDLKTKNYYQAHNFTMGVSVYNSDHNNVAGIFVDLSRELCF